MWCGMGHAHDPSTHHKTHMPSAISALQWLHPRGCQQSATHTQEGGHTVRVSHKLVQARLRLQPLICPLVAYSSPGDCRQALLSQLCQSSASQHIADNTSTVFRLSMSVALALL